VSLNSANVISHEGTREMANRSSFILHNLAFSLQPLAFPFSGPKNFKEQAPVRLTHAILPRIDGKVTQTIQIFRPCLFSAKLRLLCALDLIGHRTSVYAIFHLQASPWFKEDARRGGRPQRREPRTWDLQQKPEP
jgi:hypothetical protein